MASKLEGAPNFAFHQYRANKQRSSRVFDTRYLVEKSVARGTSLVPALAIHLLYTRRVRLCETVPGPRFYLAVSYVQDAYPVRVAERAVARPKTQTNLRSFLSHVNAKPRTRLSRSCTRGK